MTYDYNTYTGDDPLTGLAALFAITAAVPAVTGVVALPVGLVVMAWLPFAP